MKQVSFVLECVLTDQKDQKDTILVRQLPTGTVVKVCNNMEEVASFLSETLSAIKTQTTN